jgi:hypothetical protein
MNPDPQHCGHTVQKVGEFRIKIKTTERRSLLPRIAPHADVLPQATEHDELRPPRHQAIQDRLLWRFRTYIKPRPFKYPNSKNTGQQYLQFLDLTLSYKVAYVQKERKLDQQTRIKKPLVRGSAQFRIQDTHDTRTEYLNKKLVTENWSS